MLEDALWTTIYSDEQIRVIESNDLLDDDTQNFISELVELAMSLSVE